jgi:hypothetical protein
VRIVVALRIYPSATIIMTRPKIRSPRITE